MTAKKISRFALHRRQAVTVQEVPAAMSKAAPAHTAIAWSSVAPLPLHAQPAKLHRLAFPVWEARRLVARPSTAACPQPGCCRWSCIPPAGWQSETGLRDFASSDREIQAEMNRIGRRTAYAMRVILALAIVCQILGSL